jgi:DNA primase
VIPDAKIAEIRERTDIVEVVGEHVSLRRAGVNFKGVCPFHADSDPSFNVNPDRQFFHCFGCNVSGDVFSFLQRLEGIDFIEAAKRLAERYNVELPQRPVSQAARTQAEREREALKRRRFVLEKAAEFFETQLRAKLGQPAREALKARGIDGDTAKKYRLGYAPNSWSSLIDYMAGSRVAPQELKAVGLVLDRRSGNGFYDRFRHRLMFTITDPSGQPIAFSGRALESSEADQGAKYINSPETVEYTKGKVLYGLNQGRVAISKSREAILVEGNFDVVSLAHGGIENVVAPLGTALTFEQADLLRRRADRVIVVFDGDKAGRAAAAKAFPILARAQLASYVVSLPEGEDPDSIIREKGPAALKEMLSNRIGLFDKIIADSAAACDGSAQDMARRILALKSYFDVLRTSIEGDLYRKRVADAFNVDTQTVFRCLRGSGVRSNHGKQSQNKREELSLPGHVEERELVGLLLDCPELWNEAVVSGTVGMVSTPLIKGLLEEIGSRIERKESSIADLVTMANDKEIGPWLAERAMVCLFEDREKAKKALEEIGTKRKQASIKGEIKELEKEIHLANSQGDDVRVLELSRKKTNLQKQNDVKEFEFFDESVAKA